MKKTLLKNLAAVALALLFTITVTAQSEVNATDEEVIRVDTALVQVDIRATRNKRLISLTKNDLQLFVDDKPQPIESFEVEPIKLYKIVLDASGSMNRRKYERSVEGLLAMMAEASRTSPDIKFEILIFNSELTPLGVFKADEGFRVEPLLKNIKPAGGTALYASVKALLSRNCQNHFALVVITDGMDTSINPEEVTQALSANGNITYVLLLDPRLNDGNEHEMQVNDVLTRPMGAKMQKVFESVMLYPDDRWDIIEELTGIISESQSIARLSFAPENSDNKTHRIKLLHTDPKTKLVYRENFLMGSPIDVAAAVSTSIKPSAVVKTRAESEQEELDRVFGDLILKDGDVTAAFARQMAKQPGEWSDADRTALRKTLPANLSKNERLSKTWREKLLPVLTLFNRQSYEIIVVEGDKPYIGNFRTIAVVMTTGTLEILSCDEIRLAVAHELAHELTGREITKALAEADFTTLRRLELHCDAVAVLAAHILRIKPKMYIQGVAKVIDRVKEIDPAFNDFDQTHPTVETRRQLFKKMIAVLR